MARTTKPPTVDRIRADISGGLTGEKVAFPDPAAAPLGTDDEAAGTPPTLDERQLEDEARPLSVCPPKAVAGPVVFYAVVVGLIAAAIVVGAILID